MRVDASCDFSRSGFPGGLGADAQSGPLRSWLAALVARDRSHQHHEETITSKAL